MENNNNMNDKTTEIEYTATLKLTQTGIGGDVSIHLEFAPAITPEQIANDDQAPVVFGQMTALVQEWLLNTGIINEEGDLVDPELLASNVSFDIQERSRKTLN